MLMDTKEAGSPMSRLADTQRLMEDRSLASGISGGKKERHDMLILDMHREIRKRKKSLKH
ncbi:hypothetical protein CHH26_07460 [Qipengyuania flava]|nr:hypothetical protein CHH26_07460 [Qipengyuania flava]